MIKLRCRILEYYRVSSWSSKFLSFLFKFLSSKVYQVQCCNCSFVYIGLTKRDLKSRLDEHKRAIKNQRPDLSALGKHFIIMDHIISWTEAKILELETDYRKRLSFKSWHINAKPHVINRNNGSSFPAVYLGLLKL